MASSQELYNIHLKTSLFEAKLCYNDFKKLPYGTKFWQGKIVMNRHMENFDEKKIDKFHNFNAHIY